MTVPGTSLFRPMKTLQQGVTRARNPHCRVFGPLWQGRFKAKEVVDELGRSTATWRPRYTAREWLELACAHLECDLDVLRGRGREPEVASVIGIGGGRPGVRGTRTSRLLPRPLIKLPARSLEWDN